VQYPCWIISSIVNLPSRVFRQVGHVFPFWLIYDSVSLWMCAMIPQYKDTTSSPKSWNLLRYSCYFSTMRENWPNTLLPELANILWKRSVGWGWPSAPSEQCYQWFWPLCHDASQTQIWLILNKMTKLKKRTWALLTKLQVYPSLWVVGSH
jgi:hypothetical protein